MSHVTAARVWVYLDDFWSFYAMSIQPKSGVPRERVPDG
jgi:hypothetical protein